MNPPVFTGWDNYVYLFVDDPLFLKAFNNTMFYAFIVGPVGYIASYFFAWFINQIPTRVRPFYVLAFYAPSLTAGVAMSVVWLVMFADDSQGYLNSILIQMGLIYEPIQWLKDVNLIMPVIIIISLWSSLGTGFLSFVAGFTNVDRDLYDAAAVDGVVSRFQRLIYIDIPQTCHSFVCGHTANNRCVYGWCYKPANCRTSSPEDAGLTIMLHLSTIPVSVLSWLRKCDSGD